MFFFLCYDHALMFFFYIYLTLYLYMINIMIGATPSLLMNYNNQCWQNQDQKIKKSRIIALENQH